MIVVFLLINLIVDIAYAAIDPRIRLEYAQKQKSIQISRQTNKMRCENNDEICRYILA